MSTLKMDKMGRVYESANHRSDGKGFERAPASVKSFGDMTYDQSPSKFEADRIASWKREQAFNKKRDSQDQREAQQQKIANAKKRVAQAVQNAYEQNPLYQNSLRAKAAEELLRSRRGERLMSGLGAQEKTAIGAHYEQSLKKQGKNISYKGIGSLPDYEIEQGQMREYVESMQQQKLEKRLRASEAEDQVWNQWDSAQGSGCNDVQIENVSQIPDANTSPFAKSVKAQPLTPKPNYLAITNSRPGVPMSIPEAGQKVNGVVYEHNSWLAKFVRCVSQR